MMEMTTRWSSGKEKGRKGKIMVNARIDMVKVKVKGVMNGRV